MSQFDSFPVELMTMVLKYAMIRDTPFDIVEFIRVSKSLNDQSTLEYLARAEYIDRENNDAPQRLGLPQAEAMTDDLRPALKDQRFVWQKVVPPLEWPLYTGIVFEQRPHLLDWRVAGSICRHLRQMGKDAFWASKTFAFNISTAKALQNLSLTCLSEDDQRTARKHIKSIILMLPVTSSPSPFIVLPKLIAKFSGLKFLDLYLGSRTEEPTVTWSAIVKEHQIIQMQPPPHFIDALQAIGVPVEKLDAGIFIKSSTNSSELQSLLQSNIYPMLKSWARIKAAQEQKKIEG